MDSQCHLENIKQFLRLYDRFITGEQRGSCNFLKGYELLNNERFFMSLQDQVMDLLL